MRGQLSAEMLILLALILGLVFIVYTQLSKTVNNAGNAVDTQSTQLLAATNCQQQSDCDTLGPGYTCDLNSHKCIK